MMQRTYLEMKIKAEINFNKSSLVNVLKCFSGVVNIRQ